MSDRIERTGGNGVSPPGSLWEEVLNDTAERIDRFLGHVPLFGQIALGLGGTSGVVRGLFAREALPVSDLPAYISAFDVEQFSARSGDAAVTAGSIKPGTPLLVLSIEKVGKSRFINEIADRIGTGTVFKIIMNPVVEKRWSKMEFEGGFRESLANAMAVEIEERGGAPAREVLPYIRASMRRSKKDIMTWLETWLLRHGYSAAVIAVHEAMLWKPEHLAEKLAKGSKLIYPIFEYHNYAANLEEIMAAFPRDFTNQYHYMGFLPEASLVLYIKKFQELNSAYLSPIGSRLGEYIYLVTGGWLEAVNFILEEISDPKRNEIGTKFPKEVTNFQIANAARRFVLVERGVEKLRSYVTKLDPGLQKVLTEISDETSAIDEATADAEWELQEMGLVHESDDGELELSGSMLENALLPAGYAPLMNFPAFRPVR